jgi:hypothetical protein
MCPKCCHIFEVCVTNTNGFSIRWLGLLALLLQLQSMITAHSQRRPKTRSTPCWTTSVCSSTVTNAERRNTALTLNTLLTSLRVQSYIMTDGQSASLSWNKASIWGLRPGFYYCQTVAGLLIWGVLSYERTGLSFTIIAGLRQISHSRVRAPWDSQPYCNLSDSRLCFLSPPTTMVEVFNPASTRKLLLWMNYYSF